MIYIKYNGAGDFLNECSSFLMEREVENNLMLGIAGKVLNEEVEDKGIYYGAVKEDGKVLLAAVMTPEHNVILDSIDDMALEVFADEFIKEEVTIPGIIASDRVIEKALEVLSSRLHKKVQCEMELGVYRLQNINEDIENPKGRFAKAEMKHHKLITKWMYEAQIIFGFLERDDSKIFTEERMKSAENKIKNEIAFIWLDENDTPVTMAMIVRGSNNTGVVGMVYTPDEYRNNGYATACVREVSRTILLRGNKYAALFTDLSNPTSNSIYMKIGYERICDFGEYKFI